MDTVTLIDAPELEPVVVGYALVQGFKTPRYGMRYHLFDSLSEAQAYVDKRNGKSEGMPIMGQPMQRAWGRAILDVTPIVDHRA